ncbi:MAG TPA: TIGR02452 family protein [Candidatus Kapabacteria bacterium]|nr:TIGR02452 family protein [Candidatus Kapabacteria bacterium]
MNRQQRAEIAQQTLAILEAGHYRHPDGREVDLSDALARACSGSVLYRPEDRSAIHARASQRPVLAGTTTGVSNRTTLAAAKALAAEHGRVACLNFASARNPGGGFLSGSQAQEESLARATGLYATLIEHGEFYEHHRATRTALYSDRVIYSPGVPVFRDDHDMLLETPWRLDVITSAAVNTGALRENEPHRMGEVVPALESRARMVLAIAAAHACDALVLGAWGCGVFANDPAAIASVFASAIDEPELRGRFRHIEFAVLDLSREGRTIVPFRERFS